MKSKKRIGFSIIAIIFAFILSRISHRPDFPIFIFVLISIAFGGFVISLTIAVWSKTNKKEVFNKSFEISFGLSALIFIIGYLYTALYPVIL
ncbi:MAG: hypothetical protein WCY16_01400 [Weeksellaceae bacterium]